jgi:hypothetical protein
MNERACQLLAVIALLSVAHVAPVLARGGGGGGGGASGHSGFHGRVASHGSISRGSFWVSHPNNLHHTLANHQFNPNRQFNPNAASVGWWPYWPIFGPYDGQANQAPVPGEMIVINPSPPAEGKSLPLMVSNATSIGGCHSFPDGHGYQCDEAGSGTAQPTR